MRYLNLDKKISLEEKESDIIYLAIVELGGPLHSSMAENLQKFHQPDFDRMRKILNDKNQVNLEDVPLIIDLLQVFITETLDTDWGTYYEGIEKKYFQKILQDIQEILHSKQN